MTRSVRTKLMAEWRQTYPWKSWTCLTRSCRARRWCGGAGCWGSRPRRTWTPSMRSCSLLIYIFEYCRHRSFTTLPIPQYPWKLIRKINQRNHSKLIKWEITKDIVIKGGLLVNGTIYDGIIIMMEERRNSLVQWFLKNPSARTFIF